MYGGGYLPSALGLVDRPISADVRAGDIGINLY